MIGRVVKRTGKVTLLVVAFTAAALTFVGPASAQPPRPDCNAPGVNGLCLPNISNEDTSYGADASGVRISGVRIS
jgi:hypothetical protein